MESWDKSNQKKLNNLILIEKNLTLCDIVKIHLTFNALIFN